MFKGFILFDTNFKLCMKWNKKNVIITLTEVSNRTISDRQQK